MKFAKAKKIASKQKDKVQWETLDYLEQVTGDNKKTAINYLRERNDARELAEKEKRAKAVEFMQEKTKKEEYCYFLAAFAQELLTQVGFGDNWFYRAITTKDDDGIKIFGKGFATQLGILIVVKDPMDRVYIQSMAPTGNSEMDLEMIARFILTAENTYGKYQDTAGTMQNLVTPVLYKPTKFGES